MQVLADSKLTAKFQATIPTAVRELLKLDSGDRLVFVLEQGQILLKKAKLEVQV